MTAKRAPILDAAIAFAEATITERALQANVVSLAKLRGWMTYHTFDSRHSDRGFPDCIFARNGEVVVIECKREHGRNAPGVVNGVTDDQQAWLDELSTVPGVVWCSVLRPSMWYAGVLDEVLA